MEYRTFLIFSSFVTSFYIQAYTPAHAQTCAAQTPATIGWHNSGSMNFLVDSQLVRPTWEAVAETGKRLTAQAYFATGWTSFSMTPVYLDDGGSIIYAAWNFAGVDSSGTYWDHTLDPSMSASVEFSQTAMCPSGYGVAYSPATGDPYCELVNVNLRECPTDVKPDKERGCQKEGSMEGNPCSIGTGNKFQREVDYEGHPGSHLEYARLYNSDTTTPLGSHAKHWRGTFDRRLLFSEDVTYAAAYNDDPSIFMLREDGRVIHFLDGTTIYPKDASTPERLVKLDAVTWLFTNSDGSVETYLSDSGTSARLTSIRFVDGRKITLTYNSSGFLSVVSDEFGHKLTFTYSSAGRITKFTDPANKSHSYTYSTAGYLTKVTYPDTTFKQYTYGTDVNAGSLTGIIDESGATYASWTYDTSKRVTSSQHAGGAEAITIAYNTDGSRTVTDALGSVRTYQFDLIQNELKFANRTEAGVDEDVSYDGNGYVANRKDRNGVETTYVHDARGLEISRTEAAGTPRARTITTQWHTTLRVPTLITESNRTTSYSYNALGNVLTKTVTDTLTAQSRIWTYTYDAYGRVLTENGPRTDVNDTTTVAYYTCTTGGRCGRPQTVTNALGHVTTYNTYDAHGQPLTMTDPNGVVTTSVYDLRGRLTSKTVGTSQTTFEYWPVSMLKKITLPDASYLQYTYDAAHRLTGITDSENNRITYTLDAAGNRTAEQFYDAYNAPTYAKTRAFTILNQLWKEIGSAGTTDVTTVFSYDDSGNIEQVLAPLGRETSQSYDELNRVSQITDAASGTTGFEYDTLGQLISVTDPRSLTTSYEHNALGDLLETLSPDTGTTTNTYDARGNLLTSTDARGKIGTYVYDALNRVISLTYPDQTLSLTYDSGTNQKGRLKQVTDGSGSTSWMYDTQGRVLSRQQTMGVSKTASYTYTASSRVATMTLPSGSVIGYTYMHGKPASVTLNGSTVLLSNVLYQPFGRTRGWTWGNASLTAREYDLDGLPTDIDSAGLKSYSYDDASRVTAIEDAANAALNQAYTYDLLDRLTGATGTGLNQGWTYDANHNRSSQTGSQLSTYTMANGSNRLASITGALTRAYNYDTAGNVTGDGTTTFTYNDAGRLSSSTTAGVTTTYSYNALGERVRKQTAGTSTYFLYDEAGHLIGEYGSSGSLIQEIVWLDETPVAVLKPNGTGVSVFYIHTDHLNTPRRITRPGDNAIVWRWDSDPFGTSPPNEEPDGDALVFSFNLRFPGQYFDVETGAFYNYYRDGYDAATGRYTQSDPIGLASGSTNTYAYVDGNPLAWIDPWGLSGQTVKVPGTTTTVRVDNPHVPGQQKHAHVCQKGCDEVVVNLDGTGSHGTDPSKIKNKAVLKFLAKKGFKVVLKCGAPVFFIFDWQDQGFRYAVDELTWPASEAWN